MTNKMPMPVYFDVGVRLSRTPLAPGRLGQKWSRIEARPPGPLCDVGQPPATIVVGSGWNRGRIEPATGSHRNRQGGKGP